MAAVDRSSNTPSNPFSDQAAIRDERETIAEATLSVGRNATLTLGTDAVIVLGVSCHPECGRFSHNIADEGLRGSEGFNCFGLLPQSAPLDRRSHMLPD